MGSVRRKPRRIYLAGFMGSGKSTVGPVMARRLGWNFVDLDDLVETSIGQPIAAFFKARGEAAFRTVERELLVGTIKLTDHVVALGGGALCSEANLAWALTHGRVVYLRVSVPVLIARLQHEQTTRPMLLDSAGNLLNEAAVSERVSGLMAARAPFYERAHLVVDTDGKPVGEVAEAVVASLKH